MTGVPAPRGTILVDFDGTACSVDVGNALFRRFTAGAWEEPVRRWKRGEIGSRECLIAECSVARATAEEIVAFALEQPLDPTFAPFVARTAAAGWRVRVVSDGLDVYIRTILARDGLARLPVEANRAVFAAGRILPAFPWSGRGCGACGNCKGGAVAAARDHGPVVFVGDGLSDRCAARAADRVFARGGRDLLRWCRETGIAALAYDDFAEVLAALPEAVLAAPPAGPPRAV